MFYLKSDRICHCCTHPCSSCIWAERDSTQPLWTEWSTLIGPDPSKYCALIGWDNEVCTPALSCHKDTAEGTQRPLTRGISCLLLLLYDTERHYYKAPLSPCYNRDFASATSSDCLSWSGPLCLWVHWTQCARLCLIVWNINSCGTEESRYSQARLSLVQRTHYCALIGRELHSDEIFS